MQAIGVDLGGTKIEAVVLRETGATFEILHRARVATLRDEGYEAIVARVVDHVRTTCERAGVDPSEIPLGVGTPGTSDLSTGHLKNSNTTCLNGRPFQRDLQDALGRAFELENDANCFALAEARFGACRKVHGPVFGVIMGTGVGGGVVLDGRVWSGLHHIAGEWGHHAVYALPRSAEQGSLRECYCGKRGCLEAYASGPAVERRYEELSSHRLPLSKITERRGVDPAASTAIDELLDAFGRGLANVIDILDPSAIVLGGGLSNLDLLYGEGRERVASYVFNHELSTPVFRNELGDSAGVIGAALVALDRACSQ